MSVYLRFAPRPDGRPPRCVVFDLRDRRILDAEGRYIKTIHIPASAEAIPDLALAERLAKDAGVPLWVATE